jgi:hypothetical protein
VATIHLGRKMKCKFTGSVKAVIEKNQNLNFSERVDGNIYKERMEMGL